MKRKYTIKEKRAVAVYALQFSIHKAAKVHSIDRKRVREWVTQLQTGVYDNVSLSSARISGGGRHVKNKSVDEDLFEWVSNQRQKGFRVSGMYNSLSNGNSNSQ
jgi:hypothetical protein